MSFVASPRHTQYKTLYFNLIKYYCQYFKYSLKYYVSSKKNKIRCDRRRNNYRFLIDYFSNNDKEGSDSAVVSNTDFRLFPGKSCPGKKYRKNAVFVYSYEPEVYSESYYYPRIVNIGDYIQSIAARQYFSSEDVEYVDRDNICNYKSDEVNLIANGWYYFFEGNEIFSEKINPLFVSFHINNIEDVTEKTLAYLKQHQPIGCRDFATRDFLVSHNINAYFSSCLTTTLDSYARDKGERNNAVVFCDFDDSDFFIFEIIRDIIEDAEVESTTHIYEKGLSHDAYFEEAKRLIDIYARSRLVITTRIHCALPCLALKTPVILCVPHYDTKRFKGLDQMLNIVGYDENDKLFVKVCYDNHGNVINPDNHEMYANELKKMCTFFAEDDDQISICASE